MKENGPAPQTATSPQGKHHTSRIPVPSPKKNSQLTKVVTSERKALTPIQPSTDKKMMVGRQSPKPKASNKPSAASSTTTPTSVLKTKSQVQAGMTPGGALPTASSTPLPGVKPKVKGFKQTTLRQSQNVKKVSGPSLVHKEVQTEAEEHPDLALITGDDAPPEYWKQLAETRKEALEEALQENEALHQKVAELEEDNKAMEEMLEHAKKLAELVSSMTEDSGIATDESLNQSTAQTEDN